MRAEVETAAQEVPAEMRVKPAVEEVCAEVEMATKEVRAEIRVVTDGRVRQNHVAEIRIVKLFDFPKRFFLVKIKEGI